MVQLLTGEHEAIRVTGYNHYANCPCGWCVSNGRSHFDAGQVRDQLRLRDARVFLERNSAKYLSACFINPNARCPVCSSPVYFYANQFGSRVYFDDLGPPWPKHPCTDNPTRRIGSHPAPGKPPTRRPLGLAQELVASFNIIGMLRNKVVGNRNPNDWTLLTIVHVERRGEENVVKTEYMDSLKRETIEFNCFSREPLFEVGQFVSQRGKEFSFLHPEKLVPVTFVAGSWISQPSESSASSKPVTSRTAATSAPSAKSRLVKAEHVERPPISIFDFERKHFQNKKTAMAAFCENLRVRLNRYSRERTRKPREVAARLNFDKVKTACGSTWTPRLAYILLGHLFGQTPVTQGAVSGDAGKKKATTKKKKRKVGAAQSRERVNKNGRPGTTSREEAETYQVEQSFSHGRKKTVVVERKKPRKPI